MNGVGVAVDEIHLWIWAISVEDAKLHVELVVQEWSPSHVVDDSQRHEGFSIWDRSRSIDQIHGLGVVEWRISGHGVVFGHIVCSIPIDVARVGKVVFPNAVLFEWICCTRC